MAEVIQCPACMMWLNLEMHEAILDGVFGNILLYKCGKCGSVFTEDGEVIEAKEAET